MGQEHGSRSEAQQFGQKHSSRSGAQQFWSEAQQFRSGAQQFRSGAQQFWSEAQQSGQEHRSFGQKHNNRVEAQQFWSGAQQCVGQKHMFVLLGHPSTGLELPSPVAVVQIVPEANKTIGFPLEFIRTRNITAKWNYISSQTPCSSRYCEYLCTLMIFLLA